MRTLRSVWYRQYNNNIFRVSYIARKKRVRMGTDATKTKSHYYCILVDKKNLKNLNIPTKTVRRLCYYVISYFIVTAIRIQHNSRIKPFIYYYTYKVFVQRTKYLYDNIIIIIIIIILFRSTLTQCDELLFVIDVIYYINDYYFNYIFVGSNRLYSCMCIKYTWILWFYGNAVRILFVLCYESTSRYRI